MFRGLIRLQIGILACCFLVLAMSYQHHQSPPISKTAANLEDDNLSFKPQPATPNKKSFKISSSKKQPTAEIIPPQPLEPLYWHGPIQPYATTPGIVPVVSRIPTTEPVVFLGIDDGWYQTPEALQWLTKHKIPFSMFLENAAIKNNYAYFKQLQVAGLIVEDHTMTHPDLTKLTLAAQETEICGAADTYASVFGRRPTLFRPPYGSFNVQTVDAAAACGMKAVVMWHAKVDDGTVQFQDSNTSFLPGDIVLMHFRQEFLQDIQAFTNEVEKDHLQVGRLEDWLR